MIPAFFAVTFTFATYVLVYLSYVVLRHLIDATLSSDAVHFTFFFGL